MKKELLKDNTAQGHQINILIGDTSNGYKEGEIADVNAMMSITNQLPVLDITDLSKYGELYSYCENQYYINNINQGIVGTTKIFDVTNIFKEKFGTIDSLPSLCIIKIGNIIYPFYYSAVYDNEDPSIYNGDKVNERDYVSTVSTNMLDINLANGIPFKICFYYYGSADYIMMNIINEPFEGNNGGALPAHHIHSTDTADTSTDTDTPSTAEL